MKRRNVTGFTPLPELWTGTIGALGEVLKDLALADRQRTPASIRRWQSRLLPTGAIVSAFVGEDGMEIIITKRAEELKTLNALTQFESEMVLMAQLLGCARWHRTGGTAEIRWGGTRAKAVMARFGAPYNAPVRANPTAPPASSRQPA